VICIDLLQMMNVASSSRAAEFLERYVLSLWQVVPEAGYYGRCHAAAAAREGKPLEKELPLTLK
jgi:hypothetical protein